MNRPSYASALAGTLVLTLLCSACGGGSGGSSTPVAPPPPAVAPAIATGPVSQNVIAGASVTFSVSGTGTEPLSYQWQRNGADVAGATAASFVLPAAALGDTRTTWHVIVRNSAGSATSADAALKVSGIGVFAGSPTESGSVDGSAAAARFGGIAGLAFDSAGTLYVADRRVVDNQYQAAVRAISPAGAVRTVLTGQVDLSGVATDAAGNVYAADKADGSIHKITPSGVVSIFGVVPQCGGRSYALYQPSGIAVDGTGAVVVVNSLSLRRIDSAGAVSFLYGSDTCNLFGNTASYIPNGLAYDSAGNGYLGSSGVYRIGAGGALTPVVTVANDIATALAIDAQGNFYYPDYLTSTIRKVTPAGVVSTVAGVAGSDELKLGALPGGLSYPRGIAVDKFGDLYVGSSGAIIKIQFP